MEPSINTINNFYFSAPTSPLHISCSSSSSIIAFEDFEEEEGGYEFEFSGQLDTISRSSLSTADELFDGGKIRPLKLPSQVTNGSNTPNSAVSKNKAALFPKHEDEETSLKFNSQNRGRSKNISPSRSNSRKGLSRSLSPLRVSEFALLQEHEQEQEQDDSIKKLNKSSIKNGGSLSFRWGSNKWRLKDFLLFRSASEGRATTRGKDPLKKYFSLVTSKKNDEESKSFGSMGLCTSSTVDGSVSRRRRRGHVSAHEMHYRENRAVAGELKKKTSLPYKYGLLGCLGLNPAFHGIFARS